MSSLLLWVTLSIALAQATVPNAKVPPEPPAPLHPPVTPVKPVLPVTETEGVEKEPKMWVKYVAVPDVKHGSNDTIYAYRSGKNLGLFVFMFNYIVKICRITHFSKTITRLKSALGAHSQGYGQTPSDLPD